VHATVVRHSGRHPAPRSPEALYATRSLRPSPACGGSPPILLRGAPDGRHLIGLAPGEAQCRGAIVDLRGRSSARSTLPLEERNGDAAVELVAQLVDAIPARPVPGVLGAAASDDTTDRADKRRTGQRSDLRQPCHTSLGASAPVDRRSTSRRGRTNGACGSHRSAPGHGLPEIGGCKDGRRGVPFGSSLGPGIRQPRRESSSRGSRTARRGARHPVGGSATRRCMPPDRWGISLPASATSIDSATRTSRSGSRRSP
jgi:hypothetical protein